MYDVEQVREVLERAATGSRPSEEWLRDVTDVGEIDGEPETFGLTIGGQQFFVTVELS
jgi:hypothetical protein